VLDPKAILDKFEGVELKADISSVPESCRAAFPALKRAIDLVTRIYLEQQGELADYERVVSGKPGAEREFYEFFLGPWNPLEGNESAFAGRAKRAAGAGLYPEGLDAAQLKGLAAKLPGHERDRIYDHYTVVEKGANGMLRALDYHAKYATELKEIAEELKGAAATVRAGGKEGSGFASYLDERARTLLDGDYRSADATWVRLRDTPLELVLGPYEVYIDELAGVKAAYEAMLFSVDKAAGESLRAVEKGLPELAKAFPLPRGSKAAVGGLAPIVVVDLLYAGGEARQGVMAAAFNLPNDPWVRGNVGWKQVMIRNVMRAKFDAATAPIARAVLENSTASFDPYFSFVLFHEVSHGLGPAFRADGSDVSASLGASYTAIEEAKADTGSLHILLSMGGKAGVPKYETGAILDSHVAGLFRSMRFGLAEAHGAANLIEFNWDFEKGVFAWDKAGRLVTDPGKLAKATAELLDKLCDIEAGASLEETAAFVERYRKVTSELKAAVERLDSIPTDVRARFAL
jgi:hypothetical protein